MKSADNLQSKALLRQTGDLGGEANLTFLAALWLDNGQQQARGRHYTPQ